ncbi:GntR family transcriptional regulator [Solicola gregarius]|uniref:GntR family transcriptional regulator n=1 Tax=Solicola gregarius TaxID=2908642 RepID=A0AA46YJV0_9ACTN|nr:GntR family transcriptional regulator [Solicola gregarius]UYM03881.1 GntR family transcriptional regulator [Solicola gregarius]
MNLIVVDTSIAEAPYEQVRRQIAAHVASGELKAGQKLPTVRQLATDLGLSNNTVARAYRELEAGGVIETHGRKGTFVTSTLLGQTDGSGAQDAAAEYAALARRLGLSLPEATRLLEARWSDR